MTMPGQDARRSHNVARRIPRPLILCATAMALTLIAGAARGQSAGSSAPTQPQAQTPSQTAAANDSGTKTATSAAAAAPASAPKAKPKAKRVYTEDDLSSLHGKISVVGGDSARDNSSDEDDSDSGQPASTNRSSASAAENRWREMAQQIKDQIADVDRQIADKKAEIAKAGGVAFDPSSGLSQGVIVIHDRNAQLKQLEDHKKSLEQQLQNLADQGRQAGADPGWFR